MTCDCKRPHPPTFTWRGITRPWHVRSVLSLTRLQKNHGVPMLDRICAACGKVIPGDETHICGGRP